jgi:hypothetical protein
MALKPDELLILDGADQQLADDWERKIDAWIINHIRRHGISKVISFTLSGPEKLPDGLIELELKKRYLRAGWTEVEFRHTYVRSGDNETSDWWENVIVLDGGEDFGLGTV